jgi:Putative zinc-finger
MSWHIPEPLAQAYVDGDVQGARAASVEAHVMACDVCRSLVGSAVPTDRLDAIWSEVEELVDAPRATWVERLLTGVGLPETDARLVAAAPSLHTSWFTAVVAVLAFGVWAGQAGGRGAVVFLIIAPLVPVLAVAGAYGPRVDPTYEVSVSSPYPTLRLVLLRATAVVLASGALAVVASTMVPDVNGAAAWLLPSLALVSLTLVLARWLPLPVAAGAVAVSYAVPLLAALYADADVLDVVRSASLQWTALAVGVAALVFMTADPQVRAALRRKP